MNTNTPTAPTAAAKQLVIAVSERVKRWAKDTAESYSAPSKSKPEGMNASERETLDALVNFTEKHRYQQVPTLEEVVLNEGTPEETREWVETFDTDGGLITHEVDFFEIEINEVMALRMETTRTSSAGVKLANAEAELEALRAQIALLTGGTPAAPTAGE